jgi:hypothetical protein
LIRPQPWVNWLIVAFGLALWAGLIFLGWTTDRSESGLKQVLGLRSGKLAGLFGATCLLGATQLSLVALWYRTRSRKDFHGRYRIWIWSSLIWAILFSAAISGWHLSCSAWIARHLPGRLRPVATNAWPLIATILVATASRLLTSEMARNTATRWLLRAAGLVAAATLILHFDLSLAPASIALELQTAAASLWPLLMASALLHNARYVIHVSNEAQPAHARPSRLSPIVKQVWAEVLTMGPARSTIASSLSPARLRQLTSRTWKLVQSLALAVSQAVARKRKGAAAKKRADSQSVERRKNTPPLPTIASAAESPSKSSQKSAKSTKSA